MKIFNFYTWNCFKCNQWKQLHTGSHASEKWTAIPSAYPRRHSQCAMPWMLEDISFYSVNEW